MQETEERVFQSGILSKNTAFKLIVAGAIGKKEIETLIEKLQIDSQILWECEQDQPGLKNGAA